jgi:Tripartite tricarboxylate transporter TctB family
MTNNTESASPTTANAVSADRPQATAERRSGPIDWGDVVISAALLAIFIAAFLNAQQWQPIAALFPKVATGIGAILSAAFLVRSVFFRRRTAPAAPVDGAGHIDPVTAAQEAEELGADQAESERAFFASLDLRDWLVSLAYFAAFFIGLYVLGLYVTAVLFTIAYLRFQARSSWLFSVIYAVVLTAALYGLFGYALQLPVPEGLLGLSAL